MRQLDECATYISDIPNLTKANSCIADGRVIWITKQREDAKDRGIYAAYDRATKIKLAVGIDRDTLIKYVQNKPLDVLGKDENSLF